MNKQEFGIQNGIGWIKINDWSSDDNDRNDNYNSNIKKMNNANVVYGMQFDSFEEKWVSQAQWSRSMTFRRVI